MVAIPPSVSPTILVGEQVVGGYQGQTLVLECLVQAWPRPVNYWEKDGRLITSRCTEGSLALPPAQRQTPAGRAGGDRAGAADTVQVQVSLSVLRKPDLAVPQDTADSHPTGPEGRGNLLLCQQE